MIRITCKVRFWFDFKGFWNLKCSTKSEKFFLYYCRNVKSKHLLFLHCTDSEKNMNQKLSFHTLIFTFQIQNTAKFIKAHFIENSFEILEFLSKVFKIKQSYVPSPSLAQQHMLCSLSTLASTQVISVHCLP